MSTTKSPSPLAKSTWLRLDSSRFSFQKTETLEYSLSATLISASLNLNYEMSTGQALKASGQGSFKVPLKKATGARVFSEGSFSEDESAAFSNYTEVDLAGKPIAEWPMALDRTTRGWPTSGDLPAPVLNPLLIFPAFISSWSSSCEEYFAQIVAGKKIQALKIVSAEDEARTTEGYRVYHLHLKKLQAPVVEDHWSEIEWGRGDALEFHFDEKEKVVRAVRYRISPFGSLTASLKEVVRR